MEGLDHTPGVEEALMPATWLQTDLEVGTNGERRLWSMVNKPLAYIPLQPLELSTINGYLNLESSRRSN